MRIAAATIARCDGPTWAMASRKKWIRQRRRVAPRTPAAAAFRPSWASEITSLTPRRLTPRRLTPRPPAPRPPAPRPPAQEGRPERPGLRGADRRAEHLAPAVGVDRHRDYDGDGDDAPRLAELHVGGVDPQVRPVALDRARREGVDALVDLLAQARDLGLADAGHAHGLDQLVDAAGRDALDVGLLDHGRERLLGRASGLQETGEVRALAQLGDAQPHAAGAGLPEPVAVAVAQVGALGRPPAVGVRPPWASARRGRPPAVGGGLQALDVQLHEPLRDEADIIARSRSASEPFSRSSPSAILSVVIVVLAPIRLSVSQPNRTGVPR